MPPGDGLGQPVRDLLSDQALKWGEAVAPGRTRMLGDGERPAAAAREALRDGDESGPLLLAAADTPRLAAFHAAMALADLADGADASVGPGIDGGWYLFALAAPHEALLGLIEDGRSGPAGMDAVFAATRGTGLEIGLLRMERLLRTSRDVLAVRADPLTPDRLRAALPVTG
jgi:glycosyltransferase A (GT-A) superfamily protein (DUF2064 family)